MNTTIVNGVKITWLGHASFRIDAGMIIYIDPHVLDENPPKADLILMTHDHGDHCDVENAYKLLKEGTLVIANDICSGAFDDAIVVTEENRRIKVNGIRVDVIPAYNTGSNIHVKGESFGFIINLIQTRIYHAGDTDFIPEMKEVRADVALLPIGGTFVMDIEDAVEAALEIKARVVIPMHYNFLEGMEKDPYVFKDKVEKENPNIEVRIL